MKIYLILISIVMLSGCTSVKDDKELALIEVREKIKKKLNDPYSAEFSDIKVAKQLKFELKGEVYNAWIIHAKVRGKNALGNYVLQGFCGHVLTRPSNLEQIYGGGEVPIIECGIENPSSKELSVIMTVNNWNTYQKHQVTTREVAQDN